MAKKTITQKTVKKVAAKKSAPKVAEKKSAPAVAAKKSAPKVAAKKSAPAVAVKKSAPKVAEKKSAPAVAAKNIPAKKAAAEKAPVAATKSPVKEKVEKTSIIARVDVGFGNCLYVRGQGAGLSWDQGIQLDNVSPYEWTFASTQAKGDVTFKFLINDEIWADGENTTVAKGGTSISSPIFTW